MQRIPLVLLLGFLSSLNFAARADTVCGPGVIPDNLTIIHDNESDEEEEPDCE